MGEQAKRGRGGTGCKVSNDVISGTSEQRIRRTSKRPSTHGLSWVLLSERETEECGWERDGASDLARPSLSDSRPAPVRLQGRSLAR